MISVVTITYNRANLISNAIKSVLSQNYADLEYIIIDDGSTDNTESVVRLFNDARIKYYKYERIGSLSKLRNLGIKKSSGNIIAFLDSDDSWYSNYLFELSEIYKDQNYNYTISDADLLINNKTIKESQFKLNKPAIGSAEILRQKLFNNSITIYASCFSYRRSKVNLLMNEEFQVGDNDFFLRIIADFEGCLVQKSLVLIHKHATNMTVEIGYTTLYIQAYFEEFKTLKTLRKKNKINLILFCKANSENYYMLGRNLSFLGLKSEAVSAYLNSFFFNPTKIKALIKVFIALFSFKKK